MKKLISSIMLLAAIVVAQPAMAQGINFGVKGGMNNNEMKFDESVFDSENRFGWFIGPSVKVALPLGGLGIDIAALYDQREAKINDETIKQKSILIPVNARLNLGIGGAAGVYVAAGPQFGFNIGDDEYSWKSLDESKANAENTFQLKKSNFSVNVGAGVKVKKLEVGVNYNIAMGKTAEIKGMSAYDFGHDLIDNAKVKTNAWQVYAAIVF